MSKPERLVIAVLTYKRPDDIQALLPLLVQQAESLDTDQLDVDILVVDNDPGASAREIVDDTAGTSRSTVIRYEHEAVPGISAGRNRALDASADRDLLAFIDDDERPTEHWLSLLVQCRGRYDADVVQGPVESEFEGELDPWIDQGQFFRRRRLQTGTALDVAVTNNLLLDLCVVRKLGLRFDPDMGTTGGGDTLFTRELFKAGVPMVWCAEAFVLDVVPASRSTRRWVTQRAVRTGNSAVRVELKLASNATERATTRMRFVGKGVSRLAVGAARSTAGKLLHSTKHEARGQRVMMRGLGMTMGALGFAYHEYGRGQGRVNRSSRS